MTRRRLAAALALACVAARPDNRVAGPVAAAVAASAQTIGTVAEGSPGGTLTWATWAEQTLPTGLAQQWTTHLVLLREARGTVRPVWLARRPDGYEPVLRVMPWALHDHPVLLLQFRYGAAYMRMELYAVQPGGARSCEAVWRDRESTSPTTAWT